MEADLQRFYGIDLRDLWRGDLTLRRVAVLLRHVPREAAIVDAIGQQWVTWTLADHLLDDIRRQLRVLGGDTEPKPYPGRFPLAGERPRTAEQNRRIAAARRRAIERRARIAAGEIV